jgi:hypothetical protein
LLAYSMLDELHVAGAGVPGVVPRAERVFIKGWIHTSTS